MYVCLNGADRKIYSKARLMKNMMVVITGKPSLSQWSPRQKLLIAIYFYGIFSSAAALQITLVCVDLNTASLVVVFSLSLWPAAILDKVNVEIVDVTYEVRGA